MAEKLARNRQSLKSNKLVSCKKVNRLAIEQASDTSPTEKFLTRQVTHLGEAWDEYEEARLRLMELMSQEGSNAYKRAFNKAHYGFEMVRQQAETFLEKFHEPEVEEEPDYPALAASMERELGDTIKDLKDELADAEGDLEKAPTSALWDHVERLLQAVEEKLARALTSTREAARLAPDRTDSLFENYQKGMRYALARVRKARSKMSSIPPLSNTSSTNSVPSDRSLERGDATPARSYFQKQPFPKFSGESRDYLCFRKEWRETVAPSHVENYENNPIM